MSPLGALLAKVGDKYQSSIRAGSLDSDLASKVLELIDGSSIDMSLPQVRIPQDKAVVSIFEYTCIMVYY